MKDENPAETIMTRLLTECINLFDQMITDVETVVRECKDDYIVVMNRVMRYRFSLFARDEVDALCIQLGMTSREFCGDIVMQQNPEHIQKIMRNEIAQKEASFQRSSEQ